MNLVNFRVCVPPEHFLVVVYSPLHSKPEFYEFSTCDGKPDLQVSLFTSHAVVTLPSVSRNLKQTYLMYSGRTQVLYKDVLYCALFSRSCFFFLWKLLKSVFFVLYFLKNVLYFCKLFKWVEYLFQVFIYNIKIGEL